jgi:hypothetical protein
VPSGLSARLALGQLGACVLRAEVAGRRCSGMVRPPDFALRCHHAAGTAALTCHRRHHDRQGARAGMSACRSEQRWHAIHVVRRRGQPEAGDCMEVAVASARPRGHVPRHPPGISDSFAGAGEPWMAVRHGDLAVPADGSSRGCREGRDASRAVRRPHRILLPGGPVPGVPPHGHEPPPRPRLPATISVAADGMPISARRRALFLPLLQLVQPGIDRPPSRRLRLRHHRHPQVISRARKIINAVWDGADDVHQVRGRCRRARRRARLQRGHLARVQRVDPERDTVIVRPPTCSTTEPRSHGARWASCPGRGPTRDTGVRA